MTDADIVQAAERICDSLAGTWSHTDRAIVAALLQYARERAFPADWLAITSLRLRDRLPGRISRRAIESCMTRLKADDTFIDSRPDPRFPSRRVTSRLLVVGGVASYGGRQIQWSYLVGNAARELLGLDLPPTDLPREA